MSKLKDIGVIITGNTPSKKNSEYYESNDIMCVKPGDIEEEYITSIEKTDFSEIEVNICDKNTQEKIVNQLDLLKNVIDIRKKQIDELDQLIKSQFIEHSELGVA